MPSQADCQQQVYAAQRRSSELQHAVAQRELHFDYQALMDQKVLACSYQVLGCIQIVSLRWTSVIVDQYEAKLARIIE